ncbi:MAG: hypothetical protein HY718_18900, partial [Planctomycetes bacterium]|nr:hypothetical protein [Planctomycetota bacterium]
MTPTAAPLGLFEKLRVLAAVAAAVALLYAVGWMVAAPSDPNLAVTFVMSGRAVLAMWPGLAVLSVMAGIVGTVLAGPRLPKAGLFAAAIGLAALSVHGGGMQVLLANEGATTTASRQAFMRAMAVDCALWSAIMVATWVAVTWAYRWVWLGEGAEGAETALADDAMPRPKGNPKPRTTGGAKPQAVKAGWSAMIVTGVIGVFVVWLTVGRTPVANVARGQTIASVAAGLYLGAMGARYFTGVRDGRWYLLAVPAVGLMAYLVGYLSADMSWAQGTKYQYYIDLATTPPHD